MDTKKLSEVQNAFKKRFIEIVSPSILLKDIDEGIKLFKDVIEDVQDNIEQKFGMHLYYSKYKQLDDGLELGLVVHDIANDKDKYVSIIVLREDFTTIDSSYRSVKRSPQAIADFLRGRLIGWFRFNSKDADELSAIRSKVAEALDLLSDISTIYELKDVYYEEVYDISVLIVDLIRHCTGEPDEPLKIAIDYHDICISAPKATLSYNDNKLKPDEPDPYSEEALMNLTVRQFLALLDTITIIKEEFE